MQPLNNKAGEANVDARYRTMLILWFALLVSVGLYVLLSIMTADSRASAEPSDADGTHKIILFVGAALGVITFGLSFILKRRFYAKAIEQRSARLMQTGLILALALCEATCLFGLFVYFVTREPSAYFLFALAALGMLLHFPRKSQLLAVVGERPKFGI